MDIKLNLRRFENVEGDTFVTTFEVNDKLSPAMKTIVKNSDAVQESLNSTKRVISLVDAVSRSNSLARVSNEQKKAIKSTLPELRAQYKAIQDVAKAQKDINTLLDKTYKSKFSTRSESQYFNQKTPRKSDTRRKRSKEAGVYDLATTKKAYDQMSKLEKLKLESRVNKYNLGINTNEVNKSTDALNKNTKSVLSNGKGYKSLLKHMAGFFVSTRIVFGSISRIWSTMMDQVEKAAAFEEASNLFHLAMGDYHEDAKEWADEISNALHLDPSKIYQYAGALNSLTTGLGVAADHAYIMSTNLTQLAYDMSSYLNTDYQSAYDKIESGISGQVKGLRSVGVALTQASLQELAYELGIDKSVRTMSEAEKVYLRYIQIMRQTKNMQGDLARTLMTPQNALRVVQQQFTLLGRAIGQVFIPIIQKMIPYIMAATNLLNQFATSLAEALGYEPVKINYDSVEGLKGALGEIGDEANSTRGKINRMLAPFDDLNVVESSSSGSGGSSSFDPSVYDKYINGYDMLAGLTGDFTEAAKKAEKPIKRLFKILSLFLAGSFLVKLVKGFNNITTTFDKLSKNKVIDSVAKKLKNILNLKGHDFAGTIKSLANSAGAIGAAVVSAFGAATTMRDFAAGVDTGSTALAKLAGYIAVPALIAQSFTPWGAAVTVVAGLAGAVLGYTKELERAQEYEEYQKAYDTLFDNQGISLGRLRDELGKTFEPLTLYNDSMKTVNDTVNQSKIDLDNAIEGVQTLNETIENGGYETKAEKISAIKTAYTTLKESIINADTAEKNRQIAQLDRLLQEGDITKQTYDKSKKALTEYVNLRAAEARGYTQELADLSIQLANGEITQKKYNDEVAKLASDYALVAQHGTDLQLNMAGIYDVANKGFDLENPEKMKTAIDKLKTEYNNLMTTTTTVYDTNHEANLRQLEAYDIELATLKRYGKEGSKEFETVQIARNNLYNQDLLLTQNYNDDMQSIGSTYKDVMLTMLAQIDEAGLTSNSNVSGIVKNIKDSLGELKDYDVSKSSAGIFKNFATSFESEGKTFSTAAKGIFKTYAGEIANAYDLKLSTDLKNMTTNAPATIKPYVNDAYTELGEYTVGGITKGITSNKSKTDIKNAVTNICTEEEKEFKKYNGIHSPSTLYAGFGLNQVEGLVKGIDDNRYLAVDAVTRLSTSMKDKLKDNKLSLNIDTNVEKSFNSILTKLQSFCNKWRTATNKLMSNMKTTMNSISLNKDGKITYSSMPKINVEKFAQGGFPTSGDLFFANENGVPEYITSIGGRSAVANQDQMVSALSGAIITAMSKIPTGGGNGDVVVYIGNDKVYQGQGEYQNRQSDRYGTTKIVKI